MGLMTPAEGLSVQEIRVYPLPESGDPHARGVERGAAALLGEAVVVEGTSKVYYVEGAVTTDQALALGERLLADPVTERFEVGPRTDWSDPAQSEVGYKPGVQDPQSGPIMQAARALGVRVRAAATAVTYRFGSATTPQARDATVHHMLVNKTVQAVRTEGPRTLAVQAESAPTVIIPTREASTDELIAMSNKRRMGLKPDDIRTIQAEARRIGRDFTDAEWEFIAGRRTEHCGHPTFGANIVDARTGRVKPPMMRRLKETSGRYWGDTVVSAFHDNAGVFRFFDGHTIAIKKETHNSPSAMEPYGGSATGTGGVIRDVMGTGRGFRTILLNAEFGFAQPKFPTSELPSGCLPPGYLRDGCIAGSRDYGNRMGIPTGNVSFYYHNGFRARPAVIVGAYGIAPEAYAHKGTPLPGDMVITMGGRTGKDGLHGANMASVNMTAETSTVDAQAVQIGYPYEERKLAEALLEARDAGLVRAVTDCGAAGFASAVGEMGEATGVMIDLDKVPVKYQGMSAWEKLQSESQERMVLAIDPEHLQALQAIADKHGVEMAQLGVFTGDQRFTAFHQGEAVVDLHYNFLNNGFGRRTLVADHQPLQVEERPAVVTDWAAVLDKTMDHPDIRSTEWIMRQYDHMVGGQVVLPPFGGVNHDMPNDAIVLQPLRDESPDKPYGMVQSHGMHPELVRLDPRRGTIWAAAEALSKYVAVGGCPVNDGVNKVVMMNNYIWPTPEDAETLGSLDVAVDAVNEFQDATRLPIISGKDSLSGRKKDGDEIIDIPPVIDISVAGAIPDVDKTVTADIKTRKGGSVLVFVGKADYDSMGGSVLHDVTGGQSGAVPEVDLAQLPKTLGGMHAAIQTGKVLASTAIGRGGLLYSLAKMSFGGDTGFNLNLPSDHPVANQLYNETAGCFVVEVADTQTAQELFGSLPHAIIGATTGDGTIRVRQGGHLAFTSYTERLRTAWKREMTELAA